MREDDLQTMIFDWARIKTYQYPELEYMYHVPNGGSRHAAEARKFKRMGVKSGVPDIVLPVPRGGYAGLYVELKVGNNKPTENQRRYLEFLESQGYCTQVHYSFDTATAAIEYYLELGASGIAQ